MTKPRATILAISLFALLAIVACGNSGALQRPDPTQGPATEAPEAPDPTSESNTGQPTVTTESPASSSNDASAAPPTATPEALLSEQEQAAVNIMWRMIDRWGQPNDSAVIAAGGNGHPGLVPVLVEAAGRTFEPDIALEIARALEKITGESVGGDFALVEPWFSWMSKQDPPQVELAGYDEWRSELLATIDPSFRTFIYTNVPARIPLWTVQWGGVVRDGIPPLEFPKTVSADEVDFLLPDEPVFGVTINGESRAYPHRIMGWHELANDTLGGELITFVF